MFEHTKESIKIRLVVVLIMLVLGLVGVAITDAFKTGAWNYWRILCVAYALMSLSLSWHLRRNAWKNTLLTLWHEAAHWLGLFGTIAVVSYLVKIGLIGRFEASVMCLLLLALATYLAGVYTEPTFIFLGILLGILAALLGFLDEYLYLLLLPIGLVCAVVIGIFLHRTHPEKRP